MRYLSATLCNLSSDKCRLKKCNWGVCMACTYESRWFQEHAASAHSQYTNASKIQPVSAPACWKEIHVSFHCFNSSFVFYQRTDFPSLKQDAAVSHLEQPMTEERNPQSHGKVKFSTVGSMALPAGVTQLNLSEVRSNSGLGLPNSASLFLSSSVKPAVVVWAASRSPSGRLSLCY